MSGPAARVEPRAGPPPWKDRRPSQGSERRRPRLEGVAKLRDWQAEDIVACAEAMGKLLKPVAVAQVRKFLGAVTRIDASLLRESEEGSLRDRVLLLKPRLAYVAARADANLRVDACVRNLFDDVVLLIDRVYESEDFRRLHEYVQGVIAYHRFYGGRE